MRHFCNLRLYLLAIVVLAPQLLAQTCSTTNPCVAVSVTDKNAVITGDSANLYACMGGATSCSAAALASFIAAPTSPSVWRLVATFAQYAATSVYNDPEPYSALMNYATTITQSGGAAGPVSAVSVFPMPLPAAQTPTLSVTGMVTTGTTGVQ